MKIAYISSDMKTLIIHPNDTTTDFLNPIYAPILDKTVVRGGVTKGELLALIESHHRVIMLGHGSPRGLLSVGEFPDAGLYIIDDSFSDLLSEKENNIYIWCHASAFMSCNQLYGFGSGMFISEIEEAIYFDFGDVDWDVINESNNRFSEIVGKHINQPLDVLYENVIYEYGQLAETNPIAEFNLNRLFLKTKSVITQLQY